MVDRRAKENVEVANAVSSRDSSAFLAMILKLGELLGRGGFVRLSVLASSLLANLALSGNRLPSP
jgi:hypothetical protein